MTQIESKLMKLLARSESSNQHEAQLAIAKAKALADKHDIDLDLLAITKNEERKTEPVTHQENAMNFGRLPVTFKYIITILERHFNVKVVRSTFNRKTSITLFGKRSSIEQAKEVAYYLEGVMNSLWKAYKATNRLEVNAKASWMYGFTQGLSEKLAEESSRMLQGRIEEVRHISSMSSDELNKKYQLIVQNDKERLYEEIRKVYPDIKYKRAKTSLNRPDVYQDGRRTGSSTTIPVKPQSKQLQLVA